MKDMYPSIIYKISFSIVNLINSFISKSYFRFPSFIGLLIVFSVQFSIIQLKSKLNQSKYES